MKKLYFTLCLSMFLLSGTCFSQEPCDSAKPYVSGTVLSDSAAMNTGVFAGPFYGCLTQHPNPKWVWFRSCNTGQFDFTITSSNSTDIDYICWGPFSNANYCSSLDSAHVLSCDYTTAAINSSINTTAGSFYVFCVTNYSNTATVFSFTQGNAGGPSATVANSNCNANCLGLAPAQLCYVTSDTANHPRLNFYKDLNGTLNYTTIYRETATAGVYANVGTVPAGQPGVFTDLTANTSVQAWRYKVAEKDTCGTEYVYSSAHQTIWLQSNVGTNGEINLSWNQYQGITYPTHYIFRGSSPSSLVKLDSVPFGTTSYVDLSPPAGSLYYKVGFAYTGNCQSGAPNDSYVLSDNVNWTSTGKNITENFPLYFYQPLNENAVVISGKNESGLLCIYNLEGKIVFTTRIVTNDIPQKIIFPEELKGILFAKFITEKNSGRVLKLIRLGE